LVQKRTRNAERQSRREQQQPETQRAKSLNPLIYPSWWGDDSFIAATDKPRGRKNGKVVEPKPEATVTLESSYSEQK